MTDDQQDEWDHIASDVASGPNAGFRVRIGSTSDRLYESEPFRPVLVLGPQRSYKTSGFAIPAILDWAGPALVTSVRRDVLDDSFHWRSQMGEVYIFDPAGSLLGTEYEEFRRTWNPLDHCESWDACIKTARALTEAGRVGGLNDGDFWHNLASQFVAPLLFAAVRTGRSFNDVITWIKQSDRKEVHTEIWTILNESENDPALNSYRHSYTMDERARSGVFATIWSAFRVYDYASVTDETAEALDVKSFISSDSDTLYICAPPDDQVEFRPQFTAVVRTILRETYKRNQSAQDALDALAGNGLMPCRLLVLLDEAGNIAALENLSVLATTAAGTLVQLVCVFHDMSQIEGVYGTFQARSIINNHSALVVLPGCRDTATLSYLELLLRGESVAGTPYSDWSSPRHIRGMVRGEALLIYENFRPIVLSLRSKFTDDVVAQRTLGLETDDH